LLECGDFLWFYFCMWPFEKSAAVAEPEASDIDPRAERLAQVEAELPVKTAARDEARKQVRECRQRIKDPRVTILPNGFYASVGAMTMNTPHALLERLQRKLDAEVDALLAERAALMLKTGVIR
jgi:hypothetical protein